MPIRFENRRSFLLAVLLALLAAGTLCVWGAAAAGLSISSPALEAAIQAFNETRARDTQDGSGGDVSISLPGDGDDTPGDGDGDDGGDADGNDGDDQPGDGGAAGDSSNCLLGILCLDLGIDLDADVNAGGEDVVDAPGGLNIGGLHIDANANLDDDLDAAVDANAAGQGADRCFLNLICLTANANANLATNDGLDIDALVDVDADGDDDIDADVDVDAGVGANGAQQGLLDGLLDLFIDID